MAHAGLIVKATRLCNLRCDYCHDWRAGPNQSMSFPVLARMTASALTDPEHDSVSFMWHGGETTLLPSAFYEKAMLVQSRFRRRNQQISNGIQTNGTLLTDAWVQFLRRNEFNVGVSLDGPPEIHDRTRRTAGDKPTFATVLSGIRRLQAGGVPFSVLMVIDEHAYALGPDRIFDFFLEHDIRNFGVLAARPDNQPSAPPGTPTRHYIEPARWTAFLARLYDRWRQHGDERINIRELLAIDDRLAGQAPVVCTVAGSCIGRYYAIEPNGDVMHCDLFVGDPRYTLGNVLHDSFAAIRASERVHELRAQNQQQLSRLSGCPEFAVCNGWCPHERYVSQRHDAGYDPTCCGLRPLIEHIRGRREADAGLLRLIPVGAGRA